MTTSAEIATDAGASRRRASSISAAERVGPTDRSRRADRPVLDQAAAGRFVDEHVVPVAGDFDRQESIPRAFLAQLGTIGAWGAVVPRAHGGLGLDMLSLGGVHEEFGRGCSSIRSLLTVHTMVAWAISRWGTNDQRDTWLPSLATGEALASFCLSEVHAGSDTRAIATSARPDGDGWVLHGRKRWITGGTVADLFLVFAKTDDGLAGFLVPRTAGVETIPIHDMLGTRASMLADIVLDGVKVGPEARVGPGHFAPGFVITATLDIGRYSVACGSVGIVQACLDASSAYSGERRIGDLRLYDLQLTKAKLADMVTAAAAGRLLCERAGRLKDAGDPATVMATWVAKYFASRAAARAASDAVQLHGANGCTSEYPVARYYRDAKIMEIIEGSSELQQLTIAGAADRDAR
jgi:alkylation response protein AidB-like acyl-CoA dehydrogenase